jgi:tRNA:m4X modification enzyme
VCIATCCHHACSFEDYVGKDWYLAQGFSSQEFHTMCGWSSWFSGDPKRVSITRINRKRKEDALTPPPLEPSGDYKDGNGQVDQALDGKSSGLRDVEEEEEDEEEEEREPHVMTPIGKRPAELSKERMAEIGHKVKRLLDYGRLLFMRRELGIAAEMMCYCEQELSPENFALISVQRIGDAIS